MLFSDLFSQLSSNIYFVVGENCPSHSSDLLFFSEQQLATVNLTLVLNDYDNLGIYDTTIVYLHRHWQGQKVNFHISESSWRNTRAIFLRYSGV